MGQREIIAIVKNSNKPMYVKDIRKEYIIKHGNISNSSLTLSLVRIRKFNLLEYEMEENKYKRMIYKYWFKKE